MEKDGILDTADTSLRLWLISLIVLTLSSCGLPRIVVLDDPLTPEKHLQLGMVYEKKGEYDAAIGEYEKAAGKIPAAHVYLGNVYFVKGDFGKAEESYRKAIEVESENADAMNNLAWLYYKWGRNLDEAEALVERAMRIRPERAEIYMDTLMRIREKKTGVKED